MTESVKTHSIDSNRTVCLSVRLPGDDGEVRRGHARSHKQDDVVVSGLSVVHHLLLEQFQVILVVPVHFHQTDGHLSVPPAPVHLTPAALDAQTQEVIEQSLCETFCVR